MPNNADFSTKTPNKTESITLTSRDFERFTGLADDGFYNNIKEFVKVAVIEILLYCETFHTSIKEEKSLIMLKHMKKLTASKYPRICYLMH